MSDNTILYAGMLCFALILLAFALTVREFKNMKSREVPQAKAADATAQTGSRRSGAARARAPSA